MKRLGVPIALAAALAILAIAMRGTGTLPATPEDAISLMFEAAAQGDAASYLRLFGEPLKTAIEGTQSQLGAEGFAANLRDTAAGIKGIAMTRSGSGPNGAAVVETELVFATRNEKQRFRLARQSGGWVIVNIDRADVRKPAVAYGTPVYESGEPSKPDAQKAAAPSSGQTMRKGP